TASISSFPLRHSANWWNHGFVEAMNVMRGAGGERADEVEPHALDWLDRNGRDDDWFLHVHLWDPHLPYNTPEEYGNPFESDRIPAWHTEEVRARLWDMPGPHSPQEPWGFWLDEWGEPPPRQPWQLASMDDVKRCFDGYDVGVRYADDTVGRLLDKLDSLGVLDDTAVLVSSDHGEAFGELGVYADHQAADESTCHIPGILRWPDLEARSYSGLHYHLDIAATVVDLAGLETPEDWWDGVSVAPELRRGEEAGRDHLVVSQGAWSCQRGVRWDDFLYLRTWHDGYHCWPEEMLFDIAGDVHQEHNLAPAREDVVAEGAARLEEWTGAQLERSFSPVDPMQIVIDEGGPFHTRGHLPRYLDRLRDTGRARWADDLADRHPDEASTDVAPSMVRQRASE
ncbi:MAG: sulfatase-like hydrolase/transferase, partial [Acidimicrobiia bacterium]|nr:sulfatase-like hydrolase/transferase [Acidimicrobiia bacterium]